MKTSGSLDLIKKEITRRDVIKAGIIFGGAAVVGPRMLGSGILSPGQAFGKIYDEVFPTSPFILNPFTDPLPIPKPLAPSDPTTWTDPVAGSKLPPGPGPGQQDAYGSTHQLWTSKLGLPDPIYYYIHLQLRPHSFTTSLVQPIDKSGLIVVPPDGITGNRKLPDSAIYGFEGTFPGPMINAEYGKPLCVRFINELDENPFNLDRQDFGAPDLAFLTHLHNGHTAPECDGQPHYRPEGYLPKMWCDNLYLNYPAGGSEREKQSFMWFHDHRMDHTSSNVYKGMVGLFPIYDPVKDNGDETKGLRLPGVRTENPDGTFSVDYDIPLAIYDCSLDDGVTTHHDFHNGDTGTHPEWWGKTFFQHFPNHGFVGDIFTVNGIAFPFHEVKRRKYRLRFLDASIARIYTLKLMSSRGGPVAKPGSQGQWQVPDGQQCMKFVQIASEGGLLPHPIIRDAIQLWPAKRREVIVDFTRYMDGTPTQKGDVIYLVNQCNMPDGRQPKSWQDPNYRVPILKFIVGDTAPDNSITPPLAKTLRLLPNLPSQTVLDGLQHRTFTLSRGGGSSDPEVEWLINGLPFDPLVPLASVKRGKPEVWTFVNGGGGWVHPMHLHMEEHQVLSRKGSLNKHPDDKSKEDVVALDPGEEVTIYRNFRTFLGKYVAHCHNLAHEDHAMMFGWEIVA